MSSQLSGFGETRLHWVMPDYPLFVYGSLRRGQANHHLLEGRFAHCQPAVLRDFRRLIGAHGFPIVLRAAGVQVAGELYDLDPGMRDDTLRRIDLLEELDAGRLAGRYYRRMLVPVATPGEERLAWAYVDASVV